MRIHRMLDLYYNCEKRQISHLRGFVTESIAVGLHQLKMNKKIVRRRRSEVKNFKSELQRIIRQGPSNSLGVLQLLTRTMSADINEKLQNSSIVQDAIDYLPEILYDNVSGQGKVEFW